MASLLSISASDQYKTDSALTVVSREGIDAYLSTLTPSNARDLQAAISRVLPVVSARADAISQELKSVGLILSDTMNYAKSFKQEVDEISFVNINSLLTKSAPQSGSSTISAGQQIFLTDNFELMKQYRFNKSLATFYSKYSAHLQDRRARLANSLQTLTEVHDNLSMIYTAAQNRL